MQHDLETSEGGPADRRVSDRRHDRAPAVAVKSYSFSWGSIFAGALTALIIHAALTLLGVGVGAGLVTASLTRDGLHAITRAAGWWWLVSSLVALFAGGWVSARWSQSIERRVGATHAMMSFSLVALLSAVFMFGLTNRILASTVNPETATSSDVIDPGFTHGNAADSNGFSQVETELDGAKQLSRLAFFLFASMCLGSLVATAGGIAGTRVVKRRAVFNPPIVRADN